MHHSEGGNIYLLSGDIHELLTYSNISWKDIFVKLQSDSNTYGPLLRSPPSALNLYFSPMNNVNYQLYCQNANFGDQDRYILDF